MRRVIAFFNWQAEDWKRIAEALANEPVVSLEPIKALATADIAARSSIRDGKVAYASLQATIRETIKHDCKKKWEGLFSKLRNDDGSAATRMIECH